MGLGNMGAPMANNLLSKGHKLVVFDLVQPAVEAAVAAGAIKADNPSQVRPQHGLLPCKHTTAGLYRWRHKLTQSSPCYLRKSMCISVMTVQMESSGTHSFTLSLQCMPDILIACPIPCCLTGLLAVGVYS